METDINTILVPTDFTTVADSAINHAASLIKKFKGKITLLHIVSNKKELINMEEKLAASVKSIETEYGIKADFIAREGSIFEDIGGVAKEVDATLIVMGTHGVKGFQHVTGMNALKVIVNSETPFIVVQERKMRNGYNTIVVPMDISKETKQKLGMTVSIAKYFNAKAHIFTPLYTDEFQVKTMNRNMFVAVKEFHKNNLQYEIKVAEKSGNIINQLLEYTASVDADLIAITNSQEAGVHELISGLDERKILTNTSQIPVLCINPSAVTKAGGLLGS